MAKWPSRIRKCPRPKNLAIARFASRAHHRDDQQGGADCAPDAARYRTPADPRGARRKTRDAARRGALGLGGRQPADPAGHSHWREESWSFSNLAPSFSSGRAGSALSCAAFGFFCAGRDRSWGVECHRRKSGGRDVAVTWHKYPNRFGNLGWPEDLKAAGISKSHGSDAGGHS